MKKIFLTLALALVAQMGIAQTHTTYELRYSSNPADFKTYDTQRIRSMFAITNLFEADKIHCVYSMDDRFITGGALPVATPLLLETGDCLKTPNFLSRREIGIVNVGGKGTVKVGNKSYTLDYKEALYVGCGKDEITFISDNPSKPARFYFNSTTAHKNFPTRKITLKDANNINAGSLKDSNERTIHQLIVNNLFETCQLQMGMTELKPGSVWNTMPAHTHMRRMETYFYFEVPENQAVAHIMGEPQESRLMWLHNEEAVINPAWSIHCAAGTSNYIFIWGMGGENLDYNDMDKVYPLDIK